jgi:mono/diheme cytochrome c family protein
MKPRVKGLLGVAAVAAVAAAVGTGLSIPSSTEACAAAAPKTSFAEDVMPIFKGRCIGCHQPGGEGFEKSGLDLTSYEGLMKGTKHGKMVIPKDPEGSNLVWLLDHRAAPEIMMPHGARKLSTCDRTDIKRWIREGALNN